MAAKTAPAPEPEVEDEGGLRSQMFKHEAQVEFINEQYGVDLDTLSAAEIIAYAYATRVAWRKTDTYRNLVESHKASAAQEAAAAKAEREAARAERAAAKEAAAAAKAAAAPAAPAQKATKATAAKKAQKAAAPTKATRATKASKAAASGDNPFD